jgi:hypothetical protein
MHDYVPRVVRTLEDARLSANLVARADGSVPSVAGVAVRVGRVDVSPAPALYRELVRIRMSQRKWQLTWNRA